MKTKREGDTIEIEGGVTKRQRVFENSCPSPSPRVIPQDINTATKYFISQLPDDVIYSIMSNLKLRDFVRSSVLSHRWKHICSSLPSILIFDWLNMFSRSQKQEFLGACEHYCKDNERKFAIGVNQYLESYRGTSLHSFKISFCLGHEFTDYIHRWVSFAIRMGVEHLFLELYCKPYRRKHKSKLLSEQSKENYVLGSKLFESAKIKLKHLDLCGCRVGTNLFYQFSFLETLALSFSALALYDLHSMFSYLVNLKYLLFQRCTLPVKLSLDKLLVLERFALRWCLGIREIEISNANLSSFDCISCENIAFNLSGVPNLERLSYFMDKRGLFHIFAHPPNELLQLKELKVLTQTNWVKSVPESITNFINVMRLELVFSADINFNISKMISILKAFPCLKIFLLATCCSKEEEGELQPSEYSHGSLEDVEIGGYLGTSSQIEFVKYLLKHALALKRLVIKKEVGYYVKKTESLDEKERQMVYERLQEFSKDVMLIVK